MLTWLITKWDRWILYTTVDLMVWAERKGRVFKITGTAGPDDVYLIRYYIIKSRWFNFFVHQFLRSDRDDLHDHPWNFCTYLVNGSYTENKYNPKTGLVENTRRENNLVTIGGKRQKQNVFVFRKATDQHQVVVDKDLKEDFKYLAATTLFFSGPTKREWGFVKEEYQYLGTDAEHGNMYKGPPVRRWIKWTTYLGLPDNTKSRG